MAFLPMDRLPVGQHSPHIWREHMHQMSRMGAMPTGQDYQQSVHIPPSMVTPLTVWVKNRSTEIIKAGMTHRGYVCGLQSACSIGGKDSYLGVGGISPSTELYGTPLTAVDEVGVGDTGEFYCAGIHPARISITSTDSQFQYAWSDDDDEGELKTSVLGDFFLWEDRWTIEVEEEGEDDEEWCYVERVPMISARQNTPGAMTNDAQWSGPAKLLAGSVGGTYTWQQAFTSDGADFSYAAGTYALSSTLTSTALNLAEADTNGHVCSVPDASIPAGWAPLPILGYVNMTVGFHQGVYRAWFCVQNQFSGPCS